MEPGRSDNNIALSFKDEIVNGKKTWGGNKKVVITTTNKGQKMLELSARNCGEHGLETGVSSGVGIAVG